MMQKLEDVRDVAKKLKELRTKCPEDYFYLKGWIHCLLQKEESALYTQGSIPPEKREDW